MTFSYLMLSLVFGTVGFAYVIYAKNAARFLPAIVGVLLMVVPYFLPGTLWMLLVCVPLTALPFIFREM